MDYLDGMSLEDLLAKDHFLGPDLAKPILLQVCDALAHAHRQGVLHRDLKPGNMVLLAETKGSELVQLVDFGLAQVEEEVQKLTQDGECCGSPAYMSPEHCTGEPLDGRSDIYSFGVVMYETLTGVVPFKGRTSVETMRLQVYENPPSFSQVRPDLFLPPDVEETVLRCLTKEPEKRYQTATQVKEAIQNWGKNLPVAGVPSDGRQLPESKTPSSGELDAIAAGHDVSSSGKTKEWAASAPPKKETREPRQTIEQPKSNKLKRWTDTQQKANDLRVPILVACMVMVVLVAVAGTAYVFQQEWHPSSNKVESAAPAPSVPLDSEASLPHAVAPAPVGSSADNAAGNGGDRHVSSVDSSAPAGTTDRPIDEEIPPSTVTMTSASAEPPAQAAAAVSSVQPADNAMVEDENGLRIPADQGEQPTHAAPPPEPAAAHAPIKQTALLPAPSVQPTPVAPQPKPEPAGKPATTPSKPATATSKPGATAKPSINPGVVDFFSHPAPKPAATPTKPAPAKPATKPAPAKPPVNAVKPAQAPPPAVKPAAPPHPASVTPPAPAKPHPKPAPKPHKPPKKKAAAPKAVSAPPKPAPEPPPPPTVPTHRRAYQTY
jgi:serine/threonine-protein kinase